MQYIIGQPDFIKHLDAWLFKNTQPDANWIATKSAQIPAMFRTYTKPLYRGMLVDKEFLEDISKPGASIQFKNHSSWTKEESVATKFIKDEAFKTVKGSGQTGIIIRKMINTPSIVLDIHGFVMFMGASQLEMLGMDEMSIDSAMKEHEILIKKGVKITNKDIIKR